MTAALVDVRDLAAVTVKALTAPNEGTGKVTEVLIQGEVTSWEEIIEIAKKKFPALEVKMKAPFPKPYRADTGRAERDFGIKWRETEEVVEAALGHCFWAEELA
jgi:nucleoside-diphosphate-sugar epimerase